MPKMTLLDMTQNILSALDSDNVNSITDTEEAEQVAEVIKETYFAMIDELHLPASGTTFQLEATSASTPMKMKIPDIIEKLEWVRYNHETVDDTDADYKRIHYLSPDDFMEHISNRAESADNITLYSDGVDFLIRTDAHPQFYTSFDDVYLYFDSYNSAEEANLQASKSMCYGLTNSSWTHTDLAIPNLPVNLFSLLLAESKSQCFLNLKQMPNQKEEQKARRQRIAIRKSKWKTDGGIKTPNYGRK